MAVSVYIPTPFRAHTANQSQLEVEASDVKSLLDLLEARHAGLRGLIRDEVGEVHHHVNVYVNKEEIGALQGQATTLRPGDEVAIIPALAGGRA
jgi:molybdopterin converting factor small subunit